MSFLLRAALVIGALSYLAATREGVAPPDARGLLPATWNGLSPEARDALTREGAAEIARLSGTIANAARDPAPSRDTLGAADRRPTWRGAEPR